MKLLNIGSDKSLFNPTADLAQRQARLGRIFEELHIIVFSKKGYAQSQLSNNVFAYPTNSWAKVFYYWDAYQLAKSILSKSDFNSWVVTTQDPYDSGPLGWFIKKIFKIPLQAQVHTDIFSPYFQRESLANKLRLVIAKFILTRADQIRVVSPRIKNSLVAVMKINPEKIFVLPVFIDVEKYRQAAPQVNLHQKYPDFDFIVLMASRFSPEKNIPLAIKVFKKIAITHPRILLLIRGRGPEEEKLRVLVADCRNIKFEPWQDEVYSSYKTADLFLLTSNYEGFGMTVIEAMASGVPVIMTDVGNSNGIVVPVNDDSALQEAILLLIKNKEKRQGLIDTGYETIARFPNAHQYVALVELIFKNLKT